MILPAGQEIHAKDIVEARKLPRESRRDFYRQLLEQAELRNKMEIGDLPAEKHTPTVFLEIIQQLLDKDGSFDPAQLPEVPNPMSTRKLMTKDFRFWKIHTTLGDEETFTDQICYNTISKQFWVLRVGVVSGVNFLYGPGKINNHDGHNSL